MWKWFNATECRLLSSYSRGIKRVYVWNSHKSKRAQLLPVSFTKIKWICNYSNGTNRNDSDIRGGHASFGLQWLWKHRPIGSKMWDVLDVGQMRTKTKLPLQAVVKLSMEWVPILDNWVATDILLSILICLGMCLQSKSTWFIASQFVNKCVYNVMF